MSKSLMFEIEGLLMVAGPESLDMAHLYFFFSKSCKQRDVKGICITLVRCNQMYLMEYIRNGKIFGIKCVYFFRMEMIV